MPGFPENKGENSGLCLQEIGIAQPIVTPFESKKVILSSREDQSDV